MTLTYTIEFFSEWHCGSGLSAGADTDALVIKDRDGLPYIPGKTIKGLFREAVEELMLLQEISSGELMESFWHSFGLFDEKGGNTNEEQSAAEDKRVKAIKGHAFFTNAELVLKEDVKKSRAQRFLFRRIASTAINDRGIADNNSLRSMETVVPCVLQGEIIDMDKSLNEVVREAAGFIKRLGQNRNRGLGRCNITIVVEEEL